MDEGFAALPSKKSQEYRMHFKIFSRVRAENGSDGVRRLCIQVLKQLPGSRPWKTGRSLRLFSVHLPPAGDIHGAVLEGVQIRQALAGAQGHTGRPKCEHCAHS